ncbi:MAG: tetratricopeptide repeat protein [Deltaproteobacteria bacterium]|nr:tetratricopeptide repeat protein [Deltaproteobacteria bacterium]
MTTHSLKQEIDFLLVGRNQEILERDAQILQETGYGNIRIVRSGIEARNLLKDMNVHFVVTEWRMPCMNGIELLRLIRRTSGLSDIPVLMTSDNRHRDMVLYAIDEMVDGYLAMPYSREDLLHAVSAVRKRKQLSPLQAGIRQARHFVLLKNYDKAIEKAKEILGHDPKNTDALFVLSESYYWLRDLDKAKQFLKAYLQENPASGKGMHLLSKVCRLDGQSGDAFGLLLKAHKENPLNIDLTIDLGKFYLEMNMEDNAREIFNLVMSSEPTDLNLIKIGKALLKKGRAEEAAQYLDKTVHPLPETVYIFAQLAEMLEKGGNHEASARQFKRCLALVPDHPEYLVRLGEVLARQGKGR